MEGHGVGRVDNNGKEDVDNDLQALTDEEMEEEVRTGEETTEILEEKKGDKGIEGKPMVPGEVANRQGARKKAPKPAAGAGASNKLKMAQLVNAKRPVAKSRIRHGEPSMQMEDKGPSNPKQDNAKN